VQEVSRLKEERAKVMFYRQLVVLSVPLWDKARCIWPESFRPAGLDTFEKESFDSWWSKHKNELANLHRLIAEQWIHRHWDESYFSFLPLDSLAWETRMASSEEFLDQVNLFFGGPAVAEYDYQVFHDNQLQTAKNWVNGTWTIPPIVLETPRGFAFNQKAYPDTRLLLVEGSKRYRYLNALHKKRLHTGLHQFFVISSPLCN
jgi:hypothetical protein